MSQADQAYSERKLNEAAGKYARLKNEFKPYLSPEQLKHAEDRLAECRLVLSGGPAPQPGTDIGPVIKGRAKAIFDSELGEANKALTSGAPGAARDHVAKAELAINEARQYFPESEFENLTKQVSDLKAKIAKAETDLAATEATRRDTALRQAQATQEQIQREERERKIVELIDRARAYQSELRYTEALQAVDQLLFLDPINPTGLLLKELLSDIVLLKQDARIYGEKNLGYARLSMENQLASIPAPGLMNYPEDWPAISVRRGEPMQFADSQENRKILADLSSKRIPSVAFNDNSLADVIQFVQSVSNQNLDVDWASLEQANIQKETTVSLNLTNVSIKTLLDRIVEKVSGSDRSSRADWTIMDGVVTVASDEKIRKHTALLIYDVRDLLIEVPDYTDVPRIDLQQALQSNQGGGGGQSPFRDTGQNDQRQLLRDREQRMDDLISIITGNIDFEGWQDNGGDTGKIQKLTNAGNLIITNTPKNHRAISGLLSKLRDVRAMQINVETRFLLVNQNFFEQIGFDLDVYLNANNNQVRTHRAADRTFLASNLFNGGRYLSSSTGPQAPNAATTTPNGTALTQGTVPPNQWSPIAFQQDSLGLASTIAPRTDWSDAIIAANPALGIGGQFLDDVQVDFLVTATQADRRAIQLTAPRLTFTNGQTANIYVATQTAFVSDLQPVVGDSAVGFDPTVSVVTEGVTLLVEGTVSADRRYVTLNVDAGVARVDGFAQQSVSAVAGGQLVNSASVQSFIQLPKVTVTRVRTTVTVPDQGTILMGGQRLITEYEVETGVPILSKLPILNRFFTNRIESKEEQTLLILMKPTILIQNEEEEKNYPGLLDSLKTGLGG
jgi:general secretion pathway protein D